LTLCLIKYITNLSLSDIDVMFDKLHHNSAKDDSSNKGRYIPVVYPLWSALCWGFCFWHIIYVKNWRKLKKYQCILMLWQLYIVNKQQMVWHHGTNIFNCFPTTYWPWFEDQFDYCGVVNTFFACGVFLKRLTLQMT
jgi:hypothetical protein